MLVKLRLDRRIVDQAEHLAEDVDVLGAQQFGEGRSLFEQGVSVFQSRALGVSNVP